MAKINIFYSHYNVEGKGNKNRPASFDYESCFVNLLKTVKDKDVSIHLVMDGKIENNWVYKYKDYYTSHEIDGKGNINNVTKEFYKIAKHADIADSDLIYILENDYLHVDDWVDKIICLYQTFKELSYVSLYDHNDKYFLPQYDDLVSKIFTTNNHHWRTTPSTCGSYITTKKIFDEDYNDHTGVTVPIGDHHKWIFLSETKNRFVLSPIPGLSTHCMEGLMSPTINWDQIK
jgi:hypothetical protein